jgi:hypothetical protein
VGHLACMGDMSNACGTLLGKYERKKPLGIYRRII